MPKTGTTAHPASPLLRSRKHAAYQELSQRMERQQKLGALAARMAMEKEVMGKGRKRKLKPAAPDGSSAPPVFRWKRERKR